MQALKLVQEGEYDLILMDLQMPQMDGYEASKAIRNLQLSQQPIIIALSASGRGDVDLKQRRAGINDYVPKPFKPEELFEALAHHLEISRNEPEKSVPEELGREEKKENRIIRALESEAPLFDLSELLNG